jgi:hypothetical protein
MYLPFLEEYSWRPFMELFLALPDRAYYWAMCLARRTSNLHERRYMGSARKTLHRMDRCILLSAVKKRLRYQFMLLLPGFPETSVFVCFPRPKMAFDTRLWCPSLDLPNRGAKVLMCVRFSGLRRTREGWHGFCGDKKALRAWLCVLLSSTSNPFHRIVMVFFSGLPRNRFSLVAMSPFLVGIEITKDRSDEFCGNRSHPRHGICVLFSSVKARWMQWEWCASSAFPKTIVRGSMLSLLARPGDE